MPVGEMLARMDARELDDWQAYERLEPFGDWTVMQMVAQLTALVANVLKGKGGKDVMVADLMPKVEVEKEEMDSLAMKRMLMKAFPPQAKTDPAAKPGKMAKARR